MYFQFRSKGLFSNMRTLRFAILGLLLLWLAAVSGKFLVLDDPQKSDTIVVLAGEADRRPARALELLARGYAGRIVLDVPGDARIYGTTYVGLARKWAGSLPQAPYLTVCPIHGLSTKAEAVESAACIQAVGGGSVLLVTSDFHTRRAFITFRHLLGNRSLHVAAAYDPTQFGVLWWRHRQWAKTNLDEWMRLLWWQSIDRWL
jgi:hypothetical protein